MIATCTRAYALSQLSRPHFHSEISAIERLLSTVKVQNALSLDDSRRSRSLPEPYIAATL